MGQFTFIIPFGTTFSITINFISVEKLGGKNTSSFSLCCPLCSFFSYVLEEKADISLIIGGVLGIAAVYVVNYATIKQGVKND